MQTLLAIGVAAVSAWLLLLLAWRTAHSAARMSFLTLFGSLLLTIGAALGAAVIVTFPSYALAALAVPTILVVCLRYVPAPRKQPAGTAYFLAGAMLMPLIFGVGLAGWYLVAAKTSDRAATQTLKQLHGAAEELQKKTASLAADPAIQQSMVSPVSETGYAIQERTVTEELTGLSLVTPSLTVQTNPFQPDTVNRVSPYADLIREVESTAIVKIEPTPDQRSLALYGAAPITHGNKTVGYVVTSRALPKVGITKAGYASLLLRPKQIAFPLAGQSALSGVFGSSSYLDSFFSDKGSLLRSVTYRSAGSQWFVTRVTPLAGSQAADNIFLVTARPTSVPDYGLFVVGGLLVLVPLVVTLRGRWRNQGARLATFAVISLVIGLIPSLAGRAAFLKDRALFLPELKPVISTALLLRSPLLEVPVDVPISVALTAQTGGVALYETKGALRVDPADAATVRVSFNQDTCANATLQQPVSTVDSYDVTCKPTNPSKPVATMKLATLEVVPHKAGPFRLYFDSDQSSVRTRDGNRAYVALPSLELRAR